MIISKVKIYCKEHLMRDKFKYIVLQLKKQ